MIQPAPIEYTYTPTTYFSLEMAVGSSSQDALENQAIDMTSDSIVSEVLTEIQFLDRAQRSREASICLLTFIEERLVIRDHLPVMLLLRAMSRQLTNEPEAFVSESSQARIVNVLGSTFQVRELEKQRREFYKLFWEHLQVNIGSDRTRRVLAALAP